MSDKKPAIPRVPGAKDDRTRFDTAIKETLEIFMARRGTAIARLDPETASSADIARKLNEILERLQ